MCSKKQRLILISAYACEPLKGSEQGVGWNWVLQMAKYNQLHVITRANNKEHIEKYLPLELKDNITFYYYDTGQFIKHFKNRAKGLYFYYFFWQLGITSLVRKLIKEYKFDYSMHLTFGSMWMPTFLPFFKVPFIWGPIGGADGEPNSFMKMFPIKQRISLIARLLMNKTAILNPFILISSYKAIAIIARTETSADVIPRRFRSKVRIYLETSIESEIFNYTNSNKDQSRDIRIITTGRLTPSKNILSAVRAFRHLPLSYNIKFTIIGSGSERSKIEHEIKKNNLDSRVRIIPEVTRAEVLDELSNSDIYLLPSLREGGSWALMEAMAIGLPVVCLKWSGMEIITDDECAIRLPVSNPDQMPKDMAAAICKLIDNPGFMKKMGTAGRNRIKNVFNWEAKGIFMEDLFNELENKI